MMENERSGRVCYHEVANLKRVVAAENPRRPSVERHVTFRAHVDGCFGGSDVEVGNRGGLFGAPDDSQQGHSQAQGRYQRSCHHAGVQLGVCLRKAEGKEGARVPGVTSAFFFALLIAELVLVCAAVQKLA